MLTNLQVHLRDLDPEMVAAWQTAFASHADQIQISHGDIFSTGIRADAIVSPANSFGLMDGGIDLAYSLHFGWNLQTNLREQLVLAHDGELPVGQAFVIETGDALIPFMISAPTMRVPEDVSATANAYLAFRAALRAVVAHNRIHACQIRSILCPGLATLTGRMPYAKVAHQMLAAYLIQVRGHTNPVDEWPSILRQHQALISDPHRTNTQHA